MLERELKLSIPLLQQIHVAAAVQSLTQTSSLRLAAQYLDTQQRDLARQGAALRLRLEGDTWVQTLKMRGTDALSHVEYNHIRPAATLDLSLYEHTAASALFHGLNGALVLRYQTQVQRTTALITTPNAVIELALDLGVIEAKAHELPISEIEFELKSGDMADVFNIASTWLNQFGLLIELRTKSERGAALYDYAQANPDIAPLDGSAAALAIAQEPYRLPPMTATSKPEASQAYTQGGSTFLSQIIRNAALVSAIDDIAAPTALQAKYLMLMRVGMRRLQSCRQLFKPWLSQGEKQLAKQLRTYYKQFGVWRDKDMLGLELQPRLLRAGLPKVKKTKVPKNTKHTAQELAASPAFQTLLLRSLARFILNQDLLSTVDTSTQIEQKVQRRLEKWLKNIQEMGLQFDELSPHAQHQLRNKIKRLRYNLEVMGYSEKTPLYLALAAAQDQLGDLSDAYVAKAWYKKHSANQEQKQFAYTWLKEKIIKKQAKSKKALSLLQEQRLDTKHSLA